MLITISGPPGSGKSTIATGLADELDYEHVSGGDIFRALADERGYSLAAFNELAEEDDQIDRDLDRQLRETARTREDTILESRLSGWMAGEYADLKIWLGAPIDVRAARIAEREDKSVEEAKEETLVREESEKQRYQEYYGIDFDDRSIYDLGVNTARWDEETTLAMVVDAVENYEGGSDEGAFPIEDVDYDF
ncbi:(d)CMP kinase [Halospeciosus flavus]|uniref:Cytidylate kinase n=1 Tax=Halospeciosus flavus TaxID=3032283 RepID=A0ABD5Z1D4_9EURY|nr:AAA family ATPase [Halospeciosus flavus]